MNDFTELIKQIITEHGTDTLSNSQRAHAILMDLAQDQVRNRLLARHFIEAGGLDLLKRGENALIIRRLREDFSIEANAAAWISHVFAEALGLEAGLSGPLFAAALNVCPPDTQRPLTPSFRDEGEVAIGMRHTVAVLKDGTCIAHGDNDFLQCDVEDWRQVISLAAGDAHTVGLTADGLVLATGRNNHDQCDVSHLEDISAVYAFGDDTICIQQDGTAVACGKSKLDLCHFEQISAIAWHPDGVYGIRQDGRVMMSSEGWEEEDWALALADVVQIISTYVDGSFALTADGKVYKMGEPDNYFANLRDIAAMVDLSDGFAVLGDAGKVRILPYDRSEPRKASEADKWVDVTAVFGKYKRLIALTSEGRLLAACTDPDWLRRIGNLDFLNDWYPVGAANR